MAGHVALDGLLLHALGQAGGIHVQAVVAAQTAQHAVAAQAHQAVIGCGQIEGQAQRGGIGGDHPAGGHGFQGHFRHAAGVWQVVHLPVEAPLGAVGCTEHAGDALLLLDADERVHRAGHGRAGGQGQEQQRQQVFRRRAVAADQGRVLMQPHLHPAEHVQMLRRNLVAHHGHKAGQQDG